MSTERAIFSFSFTRLADIASWNMFQLVEAGSVGRPPRSQDKQRLCRQASSTKKEIPFATFLPLRTSVPKQPATQANSGRTPPTTRASHHNIFDGTSPFGAEKSRQKGRRRVGFWNLAALQHFPNVENRKWKGRGSFKSLPFHRIHMQN